jgi:hypothetical protein
MVALGSGQFSRPITTPPTPDEGRLELLLTCTVFATASAAHTTSVPVAGVAKEASTSTAEELVSADGICRHAHQQVFFVTTFSWLALVSDAIHVGRLLSARLQGDRHDKSTMVPPDDAPRSRRQARCVWPTARVSTQSGWRKQLELRKGLGWQVGRACPMAAMRSRVDLNWPLPATAGTSRV